MQMALLELSIPVEAAVEVILQVLLDTQAVQAALASSS
jgi:hypothetical protein